MNLLAVPPALAEQAWQKGSEFVRAACDRLELADAQQIEWDVLAGNALLWLAADGQAVIGAGVTIIFEQRGQKVCEIMAWGAKDQAKCAPLLKVIEDFARAEQCDLVRLMGRKGWARHLKEYSVKAVVMEKAL